MIYTISYNHPERHFIDVELKTKTKGKEALYFQLPAWRPGRYELADFAKNIQKWQAFDENEKPLSFKKVTKNRWEVDCKGATGVTIKYNYFANELNAGSTYLDETQLYVNPVNCFIYNEAEVDEICQLQLKVPADYQCAIALYENEPFSYQAKSFDELADSPFIASKGLQHLQYKEADTNFHLWFQGELKVDEQLLMNDFSAFTREQIKLFGDFPTKDYHFLFQILTYPAYHGVEHSASTVIALGPSFSVLNKTGKYESLLGVSSHELFHTWNVKRIRPIEMWPYDFTKENYTRLGYLAEGATTWYGDLMLYRSGVFDDKAYFKTFNQLLDRHYNNPGVLNLSVAESSFDTWLDGYSLGIPNRKASIYTEGALITFLLDVEIRKASQNKQSFDEVMRFLYDEIFKKGRGVAESDYQETVERIAGKKMDHFFDSFVNGNKNFTKELENALSYLGLKMKRKPAALFSEAYLGIKQNENKVLSIFPNSPAEKAGVSIGDEPIAINGIKIQGNLSDWLAYFKKDKIQLDLMNSRGLQKSIFLQLSDDFFYTKYQVLAIENSSEEQQESNKIWRETINILHE